MTSKKMNANNEFSYVRKMIKEAKDMVVVFTDAGFDIDKGRSTYGMVISDGKGSLLTYEYGQSGVMDSPLEAKLEAIAKGVNKAEGRGHPRVLFLSDCKEAVGLIKKEGFIRNLGGLTLDRIKRAMWNHKDWQIGHIPREQNLAAHFLALLIH